MLGLSALAAFGAAEIAVVYGVVGSIAELVFGVDLPLIWIVESGSSNPAETSVEPNSRQGRATGILSP